MDWETVTKVVAAGIGAATALYQFSSSVGPRARANLKTDCDLLRQFDPDESNYEILKAHIDAEVVRIYRGGRILKQQRVGASVVIGLVGLGLTAYGISRNFPWWFYVITTYLILGGISPLLMGRYWDERQRRWAERQRRRYGLEHEYAELGRATIALNANRRDKSLDPIVERINDLEVAKVND